MHHPDTVSKVYSSIIIIVVVVVVSSCLSCLVVATAALHVEIHDAPSQRLLLVVVVALEREDVEVRQHLVLRAVHDLAFAVADAVDLLRLEAQENDRRLLVLSLQEQFESDSHAS